MTEQEARKALMDAVDVEHDNPDCPHCVEGIAALDAYRAAVRAETLRETQTAPCGCPCRGECK